MDKFGVPKKVNRHVLKAVYSLNNDDVKKPILSNIYEYVELSIKNSIPVSDLKNAVRNSVQNMTELGVIEKDNLKYHIRNVKGVPQQKKVSPKLFKMKPRNNEDKNINPNSKKRNYSSDESVSGTDMKKSVKRFRTTKKLAYKGKDVLLPKARMNDMQLKLQHLKDSLDQNSSSNEESNNEEEDEDEDEMLIDETTQNDSTTVQVQTDSTGFNEYKNDNDEENKTVDEKAENKTDEKAENKTDEEAKTSSKENSNSEINNQNPENPQADPEVIENQTDTPSGYSSNYLII